jgi:hypothetical protein
LWVAMEVEEMAFVSLQRAEISKRRQTIA